MPETVARSRCGNQVTSFAYDDVLQPDGRARILAARWCSAPLAVRRGRSVDPERPLRRMPQAPAVQAAQPTQLTEQQKAEFIKVAEALPKVNVPPRRRAPRSWS